MFLIKSYIQYPDRGIYSIESVEKDPFFFFVDIDNMAEVSRIKDSLDLDYLEGVLYMEYNGHIMMGFTLFDSVDQLWAYLLNMIEELLKSKKAKTYFPDQPIEVIMEVVSDQDLIFSLDVHTVSKWKLPTYEFLKALLLGAKDFFEKMILLLGKDGETYLHDLRRVRELEKKIIIFDKNRKDIE